MPKPAPIHPALRRQIGDEIAVGFGRNEIARRYKVSLGLVSKVARERGLVFRNSWMVDSAVQAHQFDMWKQRIDKADALEKELEAHILSRPEGHPGGKRERALTYALYDVDRHHNGRYPTF